MTSDRTTDRLVWDLPLRLFHWLLVGSLSASWITAQIGYDVRQYHVWLGFWMIGLLTFRIAWGFVGPRHARFASFFPRPRLLIAHLRESFRGRDRQSAGHNPAGSLMVFALLMLIAIQAISGLFVDDDIFYAGPYASTASESVTDLMSTIHHNIINVVLALVAIHVAAVIYFSVVRKQALIRAMLTGRKSADVVSEQEEISGSRIWLAISVVIAVAIVIFNLSWV
jgi:cytochrome b